MTDNFENGFIIDLSNSKNTSEIISELSDILEMPEAKGKEICLKIGKINLSQAQLLSIKSLIESMNSKLAFIDTKSKKTKETAAESGILISKLTNKIKVQESDNIEEAGVVDTKTLEKPVEKSEEIKQEVAEEKEKNIPNEVADVAEPKTTDEIEEYSNSVNEIKEDKSLILNEKDSYKLVTEKPLDKEELPEIEDETETDVDDEVEEMSEKDAKAEISKLPTLYLQQNLRSGQTMSYDGNIVIIGDTNAGSEIIARGDITVWGILGGIAHAGARGNHYAKIRALKLNAIQLRISGYYARRPDTVNIPYIQRTNQFVPEEASVSDGAIIIKKMNE